MTVLRKSALILLAAMIAAGPALADSDSGHGHKRRQMSEIYERLNLTESQKQALEENRRGHHQRLRQVERHIDDLKATLRDELRKETIDPARIEALKTELKALQDEATDLRVGGIMSVREILTPEQYQLFQEMTNR